MLNLYKIINGPLWIFYVGIGSVPVSRELEGHRIRTMQPASGATKDAPVLRANHWGSDQSSVWRATRRIGLAAHRRLEARSGARMIGFDPRRLMQATHIEGVAAADAGAFPTRDRPGAGPTRWRGMLFHASLTDLVFPLLMVGATSLS